MILKSKFMMNPTLSQDIIYPSVDRASSTATSQSERLEGTNGASAVKIMVPHPATVEPDPTSLKLSHVNKSFFRAERESEREYSNYLLEFLTSILTGFADKFIIGKRTTILLSALLSSFLSQPEIRACYPIAKYGTARRGEWKDRLLIVDFIDFLNTERINCNSALECGELSKLISCFKIFILNDIVSSVLTPMRINVNRQ
jgi:hypothetical protein